MSGMQVREFAISGNAMSAVMDGISVPLLAAVKRLLLVGNKLLCNFPDGHGALGECVDNNLLVSHSVVNGMTGALTPGHTAVTCCLHTTALDAFLLLHRPPHLMRLHPMDD